MSIKLNHKTYWVSNDTQNHSVTRTGYTQIKILTQTALINQDQHHQHLQVHRLQETQVET